MFSEHFKKTKSTCSVSSIHRWARLLKQPSSITVFRLPTKEYKLLFSVSVCSEQTEFAVSVFRWQKTNGSCRFLLVPFSVCGIPETWRHGDMETLKHRDIDMETSKYGDMET
jgi:hypothetical protein